MLEQPDLPQASGAETIVGLGNNGPSSPPVSLAALREQRWWILGAFLVVAVVAVPCIWVFTKPVYRATALVRVAPVVSRLVFKNEEQSVPFYANFLNSQVATIRSPRILQHVLDQPKVRQTNWYREKPTLLLRSQRTHMERLLSCLSVSTLRGTELIQISMTSRSGSDAETIANAVASEFVKYSQESVGGFEVERRALLTKNLDDLQVRIEAARARKNNLLQRSDVADPGRQPLQVDDAEQLYFLDPQWLLLDADRAKALQRLRLAREKYGESHYLIKELVVEVELAETFLAERQAQLDLQPAHTPLAPGVQLENTIASKRTQSKEALEIARGIAEADEALQADLKLRNEIWLRQQELELESKAPDRISVRAVAVQPTQPYRDRRVVFSVMALAAAMGVGLALGYVRTSLDPRILQAEDVERAINVPFLGQLPAIPVTEDSQLHADPLLLESIRMVRTSLWRRLHDGDLKVVLLTSCSGRTGKSTVAALLARSMADLGKKVLLIEADLRRPSLSKRLLGHESQMGLAAVLAGATTGMNAIVPTDVPNFDVLVAGRQPDDFNFELLANGRFSECLSHWKKKYDVLLLDSPPLRSCADARILADHADGTIMVLRASHCRRNEVARAYAEFNSSGGTLLGTVLIGGRDRSDYSTDYVYGTNGQHSSEREALSEEPAPPHDHSTPS